MALPIGSRLGPYEILAPLGAGGMGEVYRATDTRLKRQVAIKILPADLAADQARLARFQREAELLASINHPHIAAIYGLEDAGGRALVMELVEGPTLADRIERGPIPIDEALPIARQIAEALEAAHEQGIVHRDLKPANIKVRDDGTVKVLDFGLAKTRESAGSTSDIGATIGAAVSAQTMALPAAFDDGSSRPGSARGPLSQAGAILGTAAYMSPEQARGRAVDKRTDVWAFGAVLYEMLTGTRAFEGSDVTEVIASVMKATPDWSEVPADTPPQVVTLIKRCLEKDKTARIGDMAVARFLLSSDATIAESVAAAVPSAVNAPPRAGVMLPWIAAALALGAVLGWLLPRRAAGAAPITHLQMDVAPAQQIAVSAFAGERPARISLVVTPDGRRVVFVGARDGIVQLYDRPLDAAAATPLAGTEGATAPFVSPDGAWIGFVADNKIKKVPLGGGPAAVVCDLPAFPNQFWGASWADNGSIVFAARPGIFKVPAAGGTPAAVTTIEPGKSDRHVLPHLLAGGTALLYTAPPNIVVRALDSGHERTIIEGGSDGRYVGSGHLLYMKAGTLMAAPFDARTLRVTGEPVAMIDGVMHGVNAGNTNDETLAGQFSLSASGTLVYAAGGIVPNPRATMTWLDRKGNAQPLPNASGRSFADPRISPDGRHILYSTRRDASRDTDIWVYDIARQSSSRLTLDGGGSPVWSPDGKHVVYAFATKGATNLYMINADGSGQPERLTTSDQAQTPTSWAATNTIAFIQRAGERFGVYVLPMDGPDARKPSLFLESRVLMSYADFSRDGGWLAYVTNESGNEEVYAQPYPGPGGKIQLSTAFGSEPLWTAGGRELLYRGAGRTTMPIFSVAVEGASPLRAGVPRVLFEVKNLEYAPHDPASRVGRNRRRRAIADAEERSVAEQACDGAAGGPQLDRRVASTGNN